MSFFGDYKMLIEEGDTLIAYSNPNTLAAVKAQKGKLYQNKLGIFNCTDMIGKPFGSPWRDTKGKAWIFALHPTPELWTTVLAHRTQIIYTPDASFILSALDLRPGSTVIESGTGSCAFSHHILKTILPGGHLYTFEYHKTRAETAREEFSAHGFSSAAVTVTHRDVCSEEGFGLEDIADADLPSPWETVKHAKVALKKDQIGRIGTFLPCIEQVQKTCLELQGLGFKDIRTVTVLVREHAVVKANYALVGNIVTIPSSESSKTITLTKCPNEMRGHTSYLTFAILPPASVLRPPST